MRHAPAAVAIVLAAALSGCDRPLLFGELRIPELRVSLPSQSFPASDTSAPENWCDAAAQQDPPCIALTLDYDLGGQVPILTEENVTYDLRLTDVAIALSATEVGKDLGGVQLVTIRVLDDPLLPAGVVIASYARPGPGAAPTSIGVTGNANLDLAPYLAAGRLPVRIEVVLDALTPAFLADVAAGFSLEVKLDYGALL